MRYAKHLSLTSFLLCLFAVFAVNAQQPSLQHGVKYHAVDDISQYYVSEKLDGVRGYWDGKQLYTRRGHKINAPKWFTQDWPKLKLDGELWIARSTFEQVSSIVRSNQAKKQWRNVKFMLFDINQASGTFAERVNTMRKLVQRSNSPYLSMIPQRKFTKLSKVMQWLDQVSSNGGEGLMLHHQNAHYKIGRNNQLMKLKKLYDAEATVVRYIPGKGKFKGLMGALRVKTAQGVEFNIGSGFNLQQRQHPPKIGSLITFQYFGKTKKGTPRFASFLRIRPLL